MIAEHAHFIGAMAIALWVWVCAMLALRWESFQPSGERKIPLPITKDSLTADKDLFDQLKYHGESLYKDLDLFFKLTLGIFGGIAFVAVSEISKSNPVLIRELVAWGLWLQLFAALFTTVFVLAHKRSAILRWRTRFPWWHIFLWGDTWGYVSGMAITFYAFFVVGPRIAALLPMK